MKITITLDPNILEKMMGEELPKPRRRKAIKKQAKIDNQAGAEYAENSKVWNSGQDPIDWVKEREDDWI